MKLHFDEPIDKTKENSAIFEFFTDDTELKPLNINKIKGKSLSRLIEERKISSYYNKKKHLSLELRLLQILVILASAVCLGMILYILSRII